MKVFSLIRSRMFSLLGQRRRTLSLWNRNAGVFSLRNWIIKVVWRLNETSRSERSAFCEAPEMLITSYKTATVG